METSDPEEKIKIGVVTSWLSRNGGGIFTSAMRFAQTMAECAGVEVFGLRDNATAVDTSEFPHVKCRAFSVRGPSAVGYAPGLAHALRTTHASILHTHGLWMHPSFAVRKACKPYVVSPHGMLDPWALRNSRWKKHIAAALFENAHLRNAACLHALCDAEADSIRAHGLRNPICVIPNGVDLPARPSQPSAPWPEAFADNRCALYLGRLHPKKNLPNLLRAWKQNAPQKWRLIIAGWDQNSHEAELQALAQQLEITDRVHFAGPLFAAAKAAAYANADAFILPSLSEGLPLVILEAWSHGMPVLMTSECNLPEGFSAGAAIQISTDVAGIASGLTDLFAMADEHRVEMGRRGRDLVQQYFAWEKIGREMLAVYRWILGLRAKPESVQD
ncbi:MAG: hypothetical protein QOD99_2435 [Chthoniobacter sp.]|nr:hypothetical protein [Chthoniobacter sp.]